jgi:hypothetical protein
VTFDDVYAFPSQAHAIFRVESASRELAGVLGLARYWLCYGHAPEADGARVVAVEEVA